MSKLTKFFYLLFFISAGFAQEKDAAYWSEFEINKKMNLRSSISLNENIRLVENYTRISTHFSQLTYKYSFLPSLDLALSYRFAQRFKYDQTMNYRNRLMFDVNYKLKLKNFSVEFRERYQVQFEDALKTNWQLYTQTFRSKVNVSFDLKKKYSPFLFGEVFLQNFNFVDNFRLGLGISYELNKKIDLSASYFVNKEVQVPDPTSLYIINTSVKYSF